MNRYLESPIRRDLDSKIVLLSGPRQVGKTTLSQQLGLGYEYFNYDASKDRKILKDQQWDRSRELVIFDEIHKMKQWKSWLKGIYDTEGVRPRLLVTGSARLNTFKKGGDSLAGRFFHYRLHPFSVDELKTVLPPQEVVDTLLRVGGFPEPFLKGSEVYAKRWRHSHLDAILREDLLDLERVRDIKSIEILIDLLRERVGSSVSYSSLATDLQVSVPTVKHWLEILESLYVIFPVRSWHRNIARAILKETKYYFYDTGAVNNGMPARLENLVACALLKALHYHADTTGSRVGLHTIRNKEGQEVDFMVVIDGQPQYLVEVKWGEQDFARSLLYHHQRLPRIPAYQIVHQLERDKQQGEARMLSVAKFLADIPLLPPVP